MQDFKYNQGFSDAMGTVTSILQVMTEGIEKAIKNKKPNKILPIVNTALLNVAEIWEECNERNRNFAKSLAQKNNMEYNEDTEILVVDEKTKKIEKREW